MFARLALFLLALASTAPALCQTPASQHSEPQKPLYDEQADARAQIDAALARAKKNHRRVLIQWGGNWCTWCIRLDALFRADQTLARKLQYEYELIHVDAGRPAGKNLDLAASYGADLKKHGYPFLTILDASGRPIANRETSGFEIDGKNVAAGHDPRKLMQFLTENQAPFPEAQKLLDDALATAKRTGQRVFVHFGAPWCGWCHRLESWLERDNVGPTLARDYLILKIDIDRTRGGRELMGRFTGGEQPGIPWYVIVDAEGRPLAESNVTRGNATTNVGFPAEPHEIAHFEQMLRQTARSLTPEQIETVVTTLRQP